MYEGLRIGALTSYSSDGLVLKLNELVSIGIKQVELYCFLLHDLQYVTDTECEDCCPSTMAALLDPHAAAERIHYACVEASKGYAESNARLRISGLASHLPDISIPQQSQRSVAIECLKKLVCLAKELQLLGHPCDVIELVAGRTMIHADDQSRPQKCALCKKEEPVGWMQVIPISDCFDYLLESLNSLRGYISTQFNSDGLRPPNLAVEIEPDAYKVIGSTRSIELYLDRVASWPGVGLNLDIGHMLIMDEPPKPDVILQDPYRSKVFNAHVSDNYRSHFADLIPLEGAGDPSHDAIVREWLANLSSLALDPSVPYSGNVSIELEACQEIDWIDRSLQNLTR